MHVNLLIEFLRKHKLVESRETPHVCSMLAVIFVGWPAIGVFQYVRSLLYPVL